VTAASSWQRRPAISSTSKHRSTTPRRSISFADLPNATDSDGLALPEWWPHEPRRSTS
jgi:hypothetical protein